MNLTKYAECIALLNTSVILTQHGNHYMQYGIPIKHDNNVYERVPGLHDCLKNSMNSDGNWCAETWDQSEFAKAEMDLSNVIYHTDDVDLQDLAKDGLGLGYGEEDTDSDTEAESAPVLRNVWGDDGTLHGQIGQRRTDDHGNASTPSNKLKKRKFEPSNPPEPVIGKYRISYKYVSAEPEIQHA